MSNVIIRAFETKDRETIRAICADTADRGQPIERFFPDRECAADLLTGYYTDYEPSSTFVAEVEGRVAGYVQGCLDNRRYGLLMFWVLIPQALFKGFKNGTLFRRELWRMAGAMLRNWPRLFAWRKRSFHSHQGHVHISVAEGFRHQRIGQKLMEAFLDHAHTRGVEELTASVHDGNTAACRFFEQAGFKVNERYPMVMARENALERYNSLLYVKDIT
ncbi:MAG: GNAT family N-acetyltransferase [Candidatus Omnitrophica bacterium]|nr:GNAT family N-acetyltransferase [Candidatus Omnitrophota bacterium]